MSLVRVAEATARETREKILVTIICFLPFFGFVSEKLLVKGNRPGVRVAP